MREDDATMDVLLDNAVSQVTRRESVASVALAREQVPQTSPGAVSPLAIGAMAGSEQPKTADKDDRREQKADDHPPPQSSANVAGKVELQFNYEQELKRTFLDLVDGNGGDDRLMRMPPEQFARYVAQIKADVAPTTDETPRLDALA